MKLCLSVCLCVFLVVSCSSRPVEVQPEDAVGSVAIIGSSSSTMRRARSVHIKFGKLAFDMGRRVINLLLKDSKEVPTTAKYRLYEKSGSYEKALEDFRKAKPVGQHEFLTPTGVGRVGRVGDRLLVIEKYGPDTGKPTLDVMKIDSVSKLNNKTGVSGKLTVRIVYKD